MKRVVYMNGRLVPENRAVVSVFDRGLNYGDGLFETIKAECGNPVFLKEHMRRLRQGGRALGIASKPLKSLEEDIQAGIIERILKKSRLDSAPAYVKITVTRGADHAGHAISAPLTPTVIIVAKPLDPASLDALWKSGATVTLIPEGAPSPAMPGVKTLNYLPNVLGKAEARKRGAYEGIFTGPDSAITEGTATNIFVVSGGVIRTPPKELVLPGIIREKVMVAARKAGIRTEEARLSAGELYSADEAFLTNSIIEVVPVIRAGRKKVGTGRPGPITMTLRERLRRLVARETGQKEVRGTGRA